MGDNETRLSDVLIGAGIVNLLYYLMGSEPAVVFSGILTACLVYAIYREKWK